MRYEIQVPVEKILNGEGVHIKKGNDHYLVYMVADGRIAVENVLTGDVEVVKSIDDIKYVIYAEELIKEFLEKMFSPIYQVRQ